MDRRLKRNVMRLMRMERKMAQRDHGQCFASPHEGYAVLLEEVEEAEEAIDVVRNRMNRVWQRIRQDQKVSPTDMAILKEFAASAAAECVQVGAMAWKLYESQERGYRSEEEDSSNQ